MIIGLLLAIVAIVLVVWLVFMGGSDEGGDVVPDDVNVTVDVEGATDGGDGGNGEG